MTEILGIKYITTKEASRRYNYSISWFESGRTKNKGPKFIRISGGKGRVYYPLEQTDKWFKENMISSD